MSKKLFSAIKKINDCLSSDVLLKGGECSNEVLYTAYCPTKKDGEKGQCNTNGDKINAGLLWLLEMFKDDYGEGRSGNENVKYAEYAILWLSNMLNQTPDEGITTLNDFYTKYIKNNTHYTNCISDGKDCSNSLKTGTGYTNFKKFIEENDHFMNMNMNTMAMLYDAFKILCNMYTEFDEKKLNCDECLKYGDEFVEKYDHLNKISEITEGSPYYQVLSTLSNDYDNFKKKYNEAQCCNFPPLPTIEKAQASAQSSKFTSSSSSIERKLFIVLSIFGAIAFFFGISYKYSLFEFRKRSQKQHLREKLKK
ncbi:BIR protein [Plasmodium berghei]|uniref:BIR protein n=2 Tax=Plasmodium berghei TaxID=5821 RepID=A0A509AVI8_PLABA|nr:BIR protein [Plasmodium berghei ANKA]CXI87185.1 BIR protein [Plasmodium berghei]SBW38274.1 BIR protein [Plasmodium berghei]SCL83192.1 BIR protein [Plasmodium berghei]SCL85440.1 BIR protein [Plasmodium berghei]VUC57386.1 BIR protein [Plasmodium berghei ANKA]|eukprot:XP_034423157.1 BIR protein [Plasmodium berghei ANKA]